MIRVILSPEYVPSPFAGRPVANGYIYIGIVDTDPEIVANQQQAYVQEEDGNVVAVAQPIRTNAGGVPQYNNSPVTILTENNYSVKVLDKNQSQVYYIPSTSTTYDIAIEAIDATAGMQTVNLTGVPVTVVKLDNSANAVRVVPDGLNTVMGLPYIDLTVMNESVTLRLVNGVYIIQ